MTTRSTTALVLVLSLAAASGCSDSSGTGATAKNAPPAAPSQPAQPARPSDPVAATAYDFLDAVFAGDANRADRQLTPAAAEQLARSGQRFAPPGSGPSGFTIGEARLLDNQHAAVECYIRGELEGETSEETLACLMKKIDGRWGVSGIAYEASPGSPPTVVNFEQPTVQQQPEFVEAPAGPNGTAPAAARTATAPGAPAVR